MGWLLILFKNLNMKIAKAANIVDYERVNRGIMTKRMWSKKIYKKNKCNVAISAHGNSIRLFRKIMEGAYKKDVVKWFIPYDKVFKYEVKV